MQLQSEPNRQAVGEHPFDQLAGLEAGPLAFGPFEHGGKQNLMDAFGKIVVAGKFTGKFIVTAGGENKFDFVVFSQCLEVAEIKGVRFAGIGAFHVDDFDDFGGRRPMKRSPLVSIMTV